MATDSSRCSSERRLRRLTSRRMRWRYSRRAQQPLLQTAAPPPLQKVALGRKGITIPTDSTRVRNRRRPAESKHRSRCREPL